MNDRHRAGRRRGRAAGFTLVELLIVILIIMLVSAVTLPVVVPAFSNRQVSEAARILQAGLAGARDSAIRYDAPRGIRLLPDPTCGVVTGASSTLFYNRFIPIEPAPDLSDDSTLGTVQPHGPLAVWTNASGLPPAFPFPLVGNSAYPASRGYYPYPLTSPPTPGAVLLVEQAVYQNTVLQIPNPPPSWFWNVRIGDKFRYNNSGHVYTIVGPMTVPNAELFVNDGTGLSSSLQETYVDATGTAYTVNPQFLFLVNGVDDDNDGYVDNGVNGVNENQNFAVLGSGGGINTTGAGLPIPDDIAEWTETEVFISTPKAVDRWTITRRPVPSANGQETTLPGGAVIDATTWDSTAERSRLPVDPNSHFVDVLLNPSGQVVPTTEFSNPASVGMAAAFYHFWISDRTDVYDLGLTGSTSPPQLPIPPPPNTIIYPGMSNFLKKDRQLVTLFARNGAVVTNSIENFDFANAFGYTSGGVYDANLPFDAAQFGIREAK